MPIPTKEDKVRLTEQARAMGNKYDCDVYGRFPWDRSERRGKPVSMSKGSLGAFVHAILSNGGDITNFFTLDYTYPRASVFTRVFLSLDAKAKIEADTEYRFDPPPVAHVNVS